MPRWAHDVEDRREQIIDAAMRVFIQKGIARATNKAIAQEAGITTGLIYYYFENKESLLQAVLETRTSLKLVNQITAEMMEQPPEVFFAQIIEQVLPFAEDPQVIGVLRVILAELPTNPNIEQIASGFIQRIFNAMEQYLKIQVNKGTFPEGLDFTLAPQVMIGTTIGFLLRKYVIQDERVQGYTNQHAAQVVTHLVLNGIRHP
jgi:AcrR family transcriptional regulator